MSFIWPSMLIALLAVPVFIGLYLILQQRRRRLIADTGSLSWMPEGIRRDLLIRRHIPPAFYLMGLTVLALALARPQMVVSLPRVEGTIILAFDVSGSMAATDIKPTRLDAAKQAAQDFVQHEPSTVQIGVVGFSDNGFSMQTPTNDQDLVLAAIDRMAPQHGTSVAYGILASLNALSAGQSGSEPSSQSNNGANPAQTPTPTPVPKGTYAPAVIILLTDGDNNEAPDPLAAAQTAADRGVRIYTIGIGSPAGTTLHINGFNVFTQLNEPLLKQIAQMTGGAYYNAQNAQDLRSIYDHLNPQLVVKPEKMEVTSIFAGVSVLMLLFGGVLSLLWFSRIP
jgi:Ca-activated chloride channel family protein